MQKLWEIKRILIHVFILFAGGLTHDIDVNEASNNSKIFNFHTVYRTRPELFDTSYCFSALKYIRFLKKL